MNTGPENEILSEHDAVQKMVNSVGESINDIDVYFRLQNERFDWSQNALDTLIQKQAELLKTINNMQQGLLSHFSAEAQYFPGVFGETISRAIQIEHDEINDAIERVKMALSGTKLEGISQRDLLTRKTMLQDEIGRLSAMIEEHARVEDQLFRLARKAGGKVSHSQ